MGDQGYDFTTGSIASKMIRFMLPVLGALVLQAMYGAVDLLVVGRFGTTAGLSAVSTGSNVVNMISFTMAALATGVTVLLGRYIGERRAERCSKVIGGAICFFGVVAIAVDIFMLLFARPLSVMMQAPAEAVELTTQYVRICGGGIIFIIAYNVISCIFRGLGNSRLPLIFVTIACVVNVVGDLVLVGVFHMNAAGAAIATVAAQAVSVVLSLLIIRRQKLPFTLKRADVRFNGEVRRIFTVGAPIAFQELLTQISFLALCAFINRLGLDASSGYGVACKLVAFIMLVPSSLMQSLAAVVAQNVGAKKEDRARNAMLTGMGFGSAIGVVIAFLTFFHGDLAASLFTSDAAVIARAFEYLRGFAPEAVTTCILFSFIGYNNGHSKTVFVLIQGAAQSFIVRLPMAYIMSMQPNASLTMIGLAAPTASCFGILINLIYYIHFRRTLKTDGRQKS